MSAGSAVFGWNFLSHSDTIEIYVNIGKGRILPIKIAPSDTVYSIKQYIEEEQGIAALTQNLLCNGTKLHNNLTVEQCNITQGKTLYLIIGHPQIKIYIQIANDDKIMSHINSRDTMQSLKKSIFNKTQIAPQNQLLFFKGECLSNEKTLEDYDINENDIVDLIEKNKSYPIFINTNEGDIELYVKFDNTVNILKFQIQQKTGIFMNKQCLVFDEVELSNDNEKLYVYGLHEKCKIDVKLYHDAKNCKIDDILVHILQFYKLYSDLYPILNDNEIDLYTLKGLKQDEINTFCTELELKEVKQKMKFRKLMRIIKHYDDNQYQSELMGDPDDTMQLLIIGDIGVGKTSLMKRYIDNKFDICSCNTLKKDFATKKEELSDNSVMEVTIWDTAGQEKFGIDNVTSGFYRKGDCIMICYDINDEESFDDIYIWRNKIEDYGIRNAVIILVGCKSDLSTDNRIEFETKAQSIICAPEWSKYNTTYCECSAKTGDNVKNLFNSAAEMVLQRRSNEIVSIDYEENDKMGSKRKSKLHWHRRKNIKKHRRTTDQNALHHMNDKKHQTLPLTSCNIL